MRSTRSCGCARASAIIPGCGPDSGGALRGRSAGETPPGVTAPRPPAGQLPEPLEPTNDPRFLAAEARFLVMAVSSTDVRERARELGNYLDGSHIVVHAIG